MSMVLKDVALDQMTFSDLTAVVEPKVQGTWNLHEVSLPLNLGFLFMASSFCGLCGNIGQASYAAANTFLGAFVQYRQRNRLAASVFDVGVMADAGDVARTSGLLDRLERTGPRPTRLSEFLDTILLAKQRSFGEPHPSLSPTILQNHHAWENLSHIAQGMITTTPINSADNRFLWRRDARLGIYYNLDRSRQASADSSASGKPSLKALLAAGEASDKDTAAVVAEYIAKLMIKNVSEVALDRPLENLSMDSLVAIELKGWICHEAGVEISVISIVQCPSLMHTGEEIRQAMACDAA
ncbi:uncharacterized protein PG986_014295 [Apiospora aurea]|uniref:Carrier domain-containing protein n=1 Tax=Apiospora aurea TaxID=335848 RepID=A0ABR1PSK3_9PEZI